MSAPAESTRVLFFMENNTTVTVELPYGHDEVLDVLEEGISDHATFTRFLNQKAARLGESGTVGIAWGKVISFLIVTR